jgi:cation transport ATPase
VAIESAGVTLLGGHQMRVVRALRLSRAVMGNIRQNLFFAFACNAAGVAVAAWGAVSLLWHPALAGDRGGGDGAVLGRRGGQCAAATRCAD